MPVVVLIARIVLGAILIVAGALKMGHATQFAQEILGFHLISGPVVMPLAMLLPFFEIGLGLYLLVGLYTRAAAVLASVEFIIFAMAIASAVMRGISTSCGCFGPNDQSMTSWPEAGRDAALALVALFIAWRAPGMLAVDRRIGRVS